MALVSTVGSNSFEIGSPSFLNAFFSTLFVLVENEDWGSRYPVIMNDLYSGYLDPTQVAEAHRELLSIRDELSQFSPSHLVWDHENRAARPLWGDDISPEITSLANYFVTSDGKDLIDVLFRAFGKSAELNVPVTIS